MLEPIAADASLMEVVGHVLADGAFVLADPDPEPLTAPVDGVRIHLGFRGPRAGTLVVDAPIALGVEIALNLSGGEACPDEQLARDALREVVNMITGAVLPRIFGADKVFHLGIPSEAVPVDAASAVPTHSHAVGLVTDDGHRVLVRLLLDDDGGDGS